MDGVRGTATVSSLFCEAQVFSSNVKMDCGKGTKEVERGGTNAGNGTADEDGVRRMKGKDLKREKGWWMETEGGPLPLQPNQRLMKNGIPSVFPRSFFLYRLRDHPPRTPTESAEISCKHLP